MQFLFGAATRKSTRIDLPARLAFSMIDIGHTRYPSPRCAARTPAKGSIDADYGNSVTPGPAQ
jgi:hypothetical protein